MNNNTFTIYKLKNYFIFKNEDGSFFKDVEKTDKVDSYTGSIDKIINRLEKDRGYNLRIDPTKRCILFGDLDHIPSEDIFNNFIQVLCKVFDVTKNKISYTSSIKPTEFSYHWSIPSIEASPKILKKHYINQSLMSLDHILICLFMILTGSAFPIKLIQLNRFHIK